MALFSTFLFSTPQEGLQVPNVSFTKHDALYFYETKVILEGILALLNSQFSLVRQC